MRRRRALAALCVTEVVSWGVLYYAFPVALTSISADTGWSTTAATAAFSAGLVTSALAGIPVGRAVDRLGPHVNLPTRLKLNGRVPETGDTGIRLLHYHSNLSPDQFLLESDSPIVNKIIDDVNRLVSVRANRPMPAPPSRIQQARRVAGKVKRAVRS